MDSTERRGSYVYWMKMDGEEQIPAQNQLSLCLKSPLCLAEMKQNYLPPITKL